MLNSQTLLQMSRVEIDKVDPSTLVNIHSVFIDNTLPHEAKVLCAIEQLGNPYCFLSGETPVRVRFASQGKQLSQSLVSYFTQLKQRQ